MLSRLRHAALVVAAFAVLTAASPVGSPAASGAMHVSDRDAVAAATTTTLTAGTAYAFSTMLSGQPVRWNPCRIIHWRYRTSGQITGGFSAVSKAVARIAKVTGTTWVYDGTTTTAPTTALLPKTSSARPPLVIGWTTAAKSDLLRGQPSNVLGVTRTTWYGLTENGTTLASIHGAVIALNQAKQLPLTGAVSWYAVTLHELGHAMGLAHAKSSRELMYPMLQPALGDLQSGDLTGLAHVGRAMGCLTV
jgi:hypothetical protein